MAQSRNRQALIKMSFSTPLMSVHSHSKDRSEDLVIPDASEPLCEKNYFDVPYWHDKDWITHTKQQKDHGNVVTRLSFLTDRDDKVMLESQIEVFTSVAKQAWNELYHHRLDPSSWTKKMSKVASFLANTLKTKFVEFCYCDLEGRVICNHQVFKLVTRW